MNRKLTIASSVVLIHVAALWALQNGLLHRALDIIVPAEILSEFITPPAPQVIAPPPAPPAPAPTPVKPAITRTPAPAPNPTPDPQPSVQTEQAAAPIGEATPQPAAPSPAAAAPGPGKVALPSSDADYLQNPKPAYPRISQRLGEHGKVVVRVLIGVDGTAQRPEIIKSSGYDRLDQLAKDTVLRWRFVPGKRDGVAEAMWFNVPIDFVFN